jgi:hypothetical protein
MGPLGKTTVPIDLLGLSSFAAPLSPLERLPFGPLADCPAIDSAGGHTVVAGYVHRRRGSELSARVVDAAGTTPFQIATSVEIVSLAAAVSPGGDALVVWAEETRPARQAHRIRILATRRPAGGAFGTPETVLPLSRLGEPPAVELVAAADEAGRFTIAWSRNLGGRRPGDTVAIESTTTAPGSPVAPARTIARAYSLLFFSSLALAVAPNGRALLAHEDLNGIHLAERAPGADRFGPGARISGEPTFNAEPAVAIRDDGRALLAWRIENGDGRGGVAASSRSARGGFSKPVVITRPSGGGSGGTFLFLTERRRAEPPLDEGNRRLRAEITPDGRALLSWAEPRPGPDGDLLTRPRVAVAPLAQLARASVTTLGNPCRPAGGVVPATGADGEAGIAWTDNLSRAVFGAGRDELPRARGRLHVAALRTSPPTAPGGARVHVRVRAKPQRLHFGSPLRLSVRCDRPCDLRGVLIGRARQKLGRVEIDLDGPAAVGTARLARPGRVVLKVEPALFRHVAPRHAGRVRVAIHACDPGSGAMTRRRLGVHVDRRPVPPLALPLDLRARRVGREILVRWRTERRAFRVEYTIEGRRRRAVSTVFGPEAYGFGQIRGRGRRAFHVRLRPRYPRRTRYVVVTAYPEDPSRGPHKVVARVEQ